MTPSVFDRANAVGKYAAKLIFDLQREYTAESGSNARSRARLARLRRDLDGTAPTWMSIGEELFAQWPQELEAPADDSPEFDRQVNAVKVALELYAVHQQSKGQGVAQKYQTDPSSRMTFGRACRRITPDPEQAKGVLRRLRVVESASDFNGGCPWRSDTHHVDARCRCSNRLRFSGARPISDSAAQPAGKSISKLGS